MTVPEAIRKVRDGEVPVLKEPTLKDSIHSARKAGDSERGGGRYLEMIREALPDKNTDVTFLFGFVHHTEGLENIFSEIYRVLKTEGLLAIEKTPWLSEEKLVTVVEKTGFIYSGNQKRVFLFTKGKREE